MQEALYCPAERMDDMKKQLYACLAAMLVITGCDALKPETDETKAPSTTASAKDETGAEAESTEEPTAEQSEAESSLPEETEEITTAEAVTEEATTQEPTTLEPTTEEPTTEEATTPEPTTPEPTTAEPTTPEETTPVPSSSSSEPETTIAPEDIKVPDDSNVIVAVYRYDNKSAGMGDIAQDTYVFFENGRFYNEYSFGDGVGGWALGNYVNTTEEMLCYTLLNGGGDPDVSTNPFNMTNLQFDDDGDLIEVVDGFTYYKQGGSYDYSRTYDMYLSTFASKYLHNSSHEEVQKHAHAAATDLYKWYDGDNELAGVDLCMYENGRFILEEFYYGKSGNYTVGNYVVRDNIVYCYGWFDKIGDDRRLNPHPDKVITFIIQEDGTLLSEDFCAVNGGKSISAQRASDTMTEIHSATDVSEIMLYTELNKKS